MVSAAEWDGAAEAGATLAIPGRVPGAAVGVSAPQAVRVSSQVYMSKIRIMFFFKVIVSFMCLAAGYGSSFFNRSAK